jgi:hypothetical protein
VPMSDATDYEARAAYADKMVTTAATPELAESWRSLGEIYRELARRLAKLRAESPLSG